MFAKLPPFLFTTRFDHLYALLVESVDERQTAQAKLAAIEAHINSLLEHALVREVVALWRTVPAASDTEIAALLAATNCEPQHFTDDAMCQACRCNPRARGERPARPHPPHRGW
ncbi:MAG: hypothetical protein M5R40_17890 [Anaerolineae bacterium]|nr:hypothetical protein [Anaerolineae bacterium]